MLAVKLVGRCRRSGLKLGIRDVIEARSLEDLLARAKAGATVLAAQVPAPAQVSARPLLPAEQRWLGYRFADADLYNTGAVYWIGAEIEDLQIACAATAIAARHDALRTAFPQTPTGTAQILDVDPMVIVAPPRRDVDVGDTAQVEAAVRALNETVSLAEGRVFRLCRLGPAGAPGLLVVVVHHICVDGFSYALLADELDAELSDSPVETAPLAPASPAEIIGALGKTLADPALALEQARAWRKTAGASEVPLILRTPGDGWGSTVVSALASLEVAAEAAPSDSFRTMSVEDRLLLAVLVATAKWAGRDQIAVDLYNHARDVPLGAIDLTQTIAYINATFPFALSIAGVGTLDTLIARFLAARAAVPRLRHGFDHLRFRSGTDAARLLGDLSKPEIGFNFRANFRRFAHRERRVLTPSGSGFAGSRSPRQREKYAMLIEGDLVGTRLDLDIRYSLDHFLPPRVQNLADAIARFMAEPAI